MARWAIVDKASTFVVNVIEWDGNTATFQVPDIYQMVEDSDFKAAPGYKWDGSKFIPPLFGPPEAGALPIGSVPS